MSDSPTTDEILEAADSLAGALNYVKDRLDAGEEIAESAWLDPAMHAHGVLSSIGERLVRSEPREQECYIGGPEWVRLDTACRLVVDALGETCYLVGSATEGREFRDVDVVVIFDQPKFQALFGVLHPYSNPLRLLLCGAVSTWLSEQTGLRVDFKVQLRGLVAESDWRKRRVPLGNRPVYDREDRPAWMNAPPETKADPEPPDDHGYDPAYLVEIGRDGEVVGPDGSRWAAKRSGRLILPWVVRTVDAPPVGDDWRSVSEGFKPYAQDGTHRFQEDDTVIGRDGRFYRAKCEGKLGDPVLDTTNAYWEPYLPEDHDGAPLPEPKVSRLGFPSPRAS